MEQCRSTDVTDGRFDVFTHVPADVPLDEPRRDAFRLVVDGLVFVSDPRGVTGPPGEPLVKPVADDLLCPGFPLGDEVCCEFLVTPNQRGERSYRSPRRFVTVDRVERLAGYPTGDAVPTKFRSSEFERFTVVSDRDPSSSTGLGPRSTPRRF